mgnify:CR=1 FL=1
MSWITSAGDNIAADDEDDATCEVQGDKAAADDEEDANCEVPACGYTHLVAYIGGPLRSSSPP